MAGSMARVGDQTSGHGPYPPNVLGGPGAPSVMLNGVAAAVVGDGTVAPCVAPNSPVLNGVIQDGSPTGTAEGKKIATEELEEQTPDPTQYGPDKVAKAMKIAVKSDGTVAPCVAPNSPVLNGTITQGSPTATAEGKKIARIGDMLSCGCMIVGGGSTVGAGSGA